MIKDIWGCFPEKVFELNKGAVHDGYTVGSSRNRDSALDEIGEPRSGMR